VHRIDRETTGIVCFARNEAAHKNLSRQFEGREVQKIYKVIVSGRMEGSAGEIDSPIMERPNKLGTMMVHPKGKEALTLLEVEEQFRSSSAAARGESGQVVRIRSGCTSHQRGIRCW
jgi:23S rRNA pseudouridine955/2504/2580 synthase/23S rRNA pseudouridine1911/1915/1917 synthase